MKLVQFKNGFYAIRRLTIFGYKFMDLTSPGFWWGKRSRFFSDCLGARDDCIRAYTLARDLKHDYGKVVEKW